jgi:hypothetical protein
MTSTMPPAKTRPLRTGGIGTLSFFMRDLERAEIDIFLSVCSRLFDAGLSRQ